MPLGRTRTQLLTQNACRSPLAATVSNSGKGGRKKVSRGRKATRLPRLWPPTLRRSTAARSQASQVYVIGKEPNDGRESDAGGDLEERMMPKARYAEESGEDQAHDNQKPCLVPGIDELAPVATPETVR